MELLVLARMLWRCRVAVVVAGVVAIGLGLLTASGASSRVGVASVRMALDTPRSQTLEVAPKGVAALEWRAALLGDLMGTDPVRERIDREMGITGEKLAIGAPYMSVPAAPDPLPEHALDIASAVSEPYQLAIQAASGLPIVAIDAGAPSRAEAAKLAMVAAEALKAEAAESASAVDGFVVGDVGPVRSRAIVDGSRRMMAAIVVVVVFGFSCVCITLVAGLARARRQVAASARRPVPAR